MVLVFFMSVFFPFHPQITVLLFFLSEVILESLSQNQNLLASVGWGFVFGSVFFVLVLMKEKCEIP